MSILLRQKASIALLVVASACLLISPLLSYKAGCIGDAKTGVLGNVELALHYGRRAMTFLLAGAAIGAVGFLLRPVPALGQRAAYAGAWFVVGGIASWLIAFQAEVWGVQSCF